MTDQWDIRREGRAWYGEEMRDRWNRIPEKMEIWEGKLYFEEEDRIRLLGVILEQVGTDRAVQLGDLRTWSDSVKARRGTGFFGDRFTRIMTLLFGLHMITLVLFIWMPLSGQDRIKTLLLAGAVSYAVALFVHVYLKD